MKVCRLHCLPLFHCNLHDRGRRYRKANYFHVLRQFKWLIKGTCSQEKGNSLGKRKYSRKLDKEAVKEIKFKCERTVLQLLEVPLQHHYSCKISILQWKRYNEKRYSKRKKKNLARQMGISIPTASLWLFMSDSVPTYSNYKNLDYVGLLLT